MKNITEVFELGMTASEVVARIIKINPQIRSMFFEIYTPLPRLKDERAGGASISLERLLFHNPKETEEAILLERDRITLEQLKKMLNGLVINRSLAVASCVKLFSASETFHLPMMDFRCEVLPENLATVINFLRLIKKRGVVLDSGRSYHYYGLKPISEKDWLKFLGQCLLFKGYASARFIGHRLIDGYAALRISKDTNSGQVPKVVAVL